MGILGEIGNFSRKSLKNSLNTAGALWEKNTKEGNAGLSLVSDYDPVRSQVDVR